MMTEAQAAALMQQIQAECSHLNVYPYPTASVGWVLAVKVNVYDTYYLQSPDDYADWVLMTELRDRLSTPVVDQP